MTTNFNAKVTITAYDRFTPAFQNFARQMQGFQRMAQNVSRSMVGVDRASRRFGGRLQSIAFRATAATAAFSALIYKTNNLNESAIKSSQQIGISVNQLRAFQYAAKVTGSSSDEMTTALESFSKSLAEAKNPSSQVAQALSSMGVKATDAKGNLRPVADVLLDISDVFKKNPDGPKKLLTGMAIGMQEMIPVLNKGKTELKGLLATYEKTGMVTSKQDIDNTTKFNTSIVNLQTSFEKLYQTVFLKVIPAFQPLIETMTKQIGNLKPDQINQITEAAISFGRGIYWLGSKLIGIAIDINKITQGMGGLGLVIKLMAGVWLTSLAVSFVILTKRVYLLGVALLTTPFGWFLAGVAAIATASYLVYKYWEPIKDFFKNLWDSVISSIMKVVEIFKSIFGINLADILMIPFKPLLFMIDKIIQGAHYLKDIFSSIAPSSTALPAPDKGGDSRGIMPYVSASDVLRQGGFSQNNWLQVDMNITGQNATPTIQRVKSDRQLGTNLSTGPLNPKGAY